MGLLDKLRSGLARTAEHIVSRFDDLVRRSERVEPRGGEVGVDTIEALEELLLSADVGVAATETIVSAVRRQAGKGGLRSLVKAEIARIFAATPDPVPRNGQRPHVTLIVGVNGTGKTTTVGKLANLLRQSGRQPLICAADTFRAAAVEQLEVWAHRAGVDIVRARPGADPAAVVFDAIKSGAARGRDPVLVDTAGRLHTRVNLMHELEKIRRVAARAVDGAPHEVLLVLDAGLGQNAVRQAEQFRQAIGVTGIAVTKLDGTARGGVVVAIARRFGLPIRFVGVGEQAEDFGIFDARAYVEGLLRPAAAGAT